MTFYKTEKQTQITKADLLVNVLHVNNSDLRAGEVTQRLKARLTTKTSKVTLEALILQTEIIYVFTGTTHKQLISLQQVNIRSALTKPEATKSIADTDCQDQVPWRPGFRSGIASSLTAPQVEDRGFGDCFR